MFVEEPLKHIQLPADVCFDAPTEGGDGRAAGAGGPPAALATDRGYTAFWIRTSENVHMAKFGEFYFYEVG
jgi:hypothetical protein